MAVGASPHLSFKMGYTVPFDLSMRRILLPKPITHHISISLSPLPSTPSQIKLLPPSTSISLPSPKKRRFPKKLTSNDLNLRHAVRVPQHDTNLAGRRALLRELADLIDDLFGRDLEPRGRGAGVRDRAGGDAFAVAVEAAHDSRALCRR